MKYVITLLYILTIAFADSVDKLEDSYVKKAEQIETQKQAALKEVAVKYNKVSKRLAESYLKALKSLLKKETQKGDFDAAIKIKGKIVEIEVVIKSQAPPKITKSKVIKPIKGDLSAYQGIWVHNHGDHEWMTYEIKGNEIWILSLYNKTHRHSDNFTKKIKLKYEQNGDEYTINHRVPSGIFKHVTYTLNFKTGKSVFNNSNTKRKVNCTIMREGKIYSHWQSSKNNNKYTLHLLTDGTCLFTINNSQSATGKWTFTNGVIIVEWKDGTTNTYKIFANKIVDNFGSTWSRLEFKN